MLDCIFQKIYDIEFTEETLKLFFAFAFCVVNFQAYGVKRTISSKRDGKRQKCK